jgi:hypothetical protein
MEEEHELCVNAKAPLVNGESKTIPLHVVQAGNGTHTLTFSDLDQVPDVTIVLEALKTGTTLDIRKEHEYTFSTASGDEAHRFNLHFAWSPNAIGETPGTEETSDVNIYSYGSAVYIHSLNEASKESGKVYIYDLTGRKILEEPVGYGALTRIDVNNMKGYAIVKVVKEHSVTTEKVYIK